MRTRVSYPAEIKMKAVQMRLAGVAVKEVMKELNIRNYTQLKTWMKWYKAGELHRFEQPVGKQYSFGKGPEYKSETEKLQTENRYLKQQIEVLKKYEELERKWSQK
jgi:transposase